MRDLTRIQGEKLDVVHEDMAEAKDNLERANEELTQKLKKTRTGNKCLIWCVVFAVITIVLVILFGIVLKVDDDAEITIVTQDSSSQNTPEAANIQ